MPSTVAPASAPAPPSDTKTKVDEAQRQLKAQLVARGSEEIEPLRRAIEQAQDLTLDDPQPMRLAIELLGKLEERHKPLTFTDVSREEMEKLQTSSSRDEAVAALVKCMGLQMVGGFQSEVLVEYHYHNFAFCQQARFCAEKASTFLSIMKVLHTAALVEEIAIAGAPRALEQARSLFEELLERHSHQLPPYSVGVFSPDEADLLRAFAERAFFRHYRMYGFMYVSRQDLSIRATARGHVPQVPRSVDFFKIDEVNPRDVPELAHLFAGPEPGVRADAGGEADASPHEEDGPLVAASQSGGAADDEVAAAIDEAIQAKWGSMDDRFKLPD